MVARIGSHQFIFLFYNFMFNLPKSFCILFSCYHDDFYTHTLTRVMCTATLRKHPSTNQESMSKFWFEMIILVMKNPMF